MAHEKHTGYWHVVADVWTARHGDKFINHIENARVVDHYTSDTLLGSYKSKAEAEARRAEVSK